MAAVPTKLVRRIVIDILCIIVVFVPWMVLHWGKVKPFHRGFYCDDESLQHPFKASSISGAANTALCIIVPILVIIITECVHYFVHRQDKGAIAPREIDDIAVHPIIFYSYKAIVACLLGCAVQQTITNIMKFSVGRLRPHFFDVCKPNWTAIECRDPISNQYRYVEDYECLGTVPKRIEDMRLSFPSGHSSMIFYTMIFLAIYLHARLTWQGSRLLRPFLQAVLIYVAVYISVSRISDYKHHWSDVLGGVVVGATFAVLTGRYVWDFFEMPNWRKMQAKLKYRTDDTVGPPSGGFLQNSQTDPEGGSAVI